MKKFISCFLVLVMVLGFLPTSAFATGESYVEGTDVAYNVTKGLYYTKLKTAVDEATAGDKIEMVANDMSSYNTININKDLSLDLMGYATPVSNYEINAGTVSISDSVGGGYLGADAVFPVRFNRTVLTISGVNTDVTLNNVSVNGHSTFEYDTILLKSGSLTINGGRFTAYAKRQGTDVLAVQSGKVTINDGYFVVKKPNNDDANTGTAFAYNNRSDSELLNLTIKKATFISDTYNARNVSALWIDNYYYNGIMNGESKTGYITTSGEVESLFFTSELDNYIILDEGEVFDPCNIEIGSGLFLSEGFTEPENGFSDLSAAEGSSIEIMPEETATLTPRILGGNNTDITYTWYKDDVAIDGVTSETYTTSEAGTYKLVVSQTASDGTTDSIQVFWKVTIFDDRAELSADDSSLSSTDFTYNGLPQAPEIETELTGIGEITAYYKEVTPVANGISLLSTADGYSTQKPTAAGTYSVRIDVAESEAYKSATDLELGTFTITDNYIRDDYTVIAQAIGGNTYYEGDTFTVDFVVSSTTEANLAHFQFELVYDETVLDLQDVSTDILGGDLTLGDNGVYVLATSGKDKVDLTGGKTATIASATFKVLETTEETTDVSIKNPVITGDGAENKGTAVNPVTINIVEGLTVTFKVADYTSFDTISGNVSESITAYVKEGEDALYTDAKFTETLMIPTVVLPNGVEYQDSAKWTTVVADGETAVTYADDTALLDAVGDLTDSIVVSPNVGELYKVEFSVYGPGTLSNANPVYVPYDGWITLPTATPSEHYYFDSWIAMDGTEGDYSYDKDRTEIPLHKHYSTGKDFVYDTIIANFLGIRQPIKAVNTHTKCLITMTTEIPSEGIAENFYPYYGTDKSFRVEPDDGYVVTSVSYSIEGGGTAVMLSPQSGGYYQYTIPGEEILGEITITAVATKYVEVTFEAVSGETTMDTVTAYALAGQVGLYASLDDIASGVPNFVFPTATAQTGYRLADTEWTDGTNEISSGDLFVSASFDDDVTLYPNVVETVEVKFMTEQAYGKLEGQDENGYVYITVNKGTCVSDINFPEVITPDGRVLGSWRIVDDRAGRITIPDGMVITENTSFYAAIVDGKFPVLYNPDYIEIISGVDEDGMATYYIDVKFRIKDGSYTVDKVYYRIGTERSTEMTPLDGKGLVNGEFITAPLSIWVETTDSYTVSFKDSDDTAISTLNVKKGDCVPSLSDPTPPKYQKFDYWKTSDDVQMSTNDILAMPITRDIEFTASYSQAVYNVTYVDIYGNTIDGLTGLLPPVAKANEDFSFAPVLEDALIKSATVYSPTKDKACFFDENGIFTLDGEYVDGDLKVVIYYTQGKISFIYDSQYKALTPDTKIAVLTGATADTNYKIAGTNMFYSEKYGAYLLVVDANATVAEVMSEISTGTADVPTITYDTDINGNGTDVTDAGRINAFLHDLAVTGASGGNGFSQFEGIVSISQTLERLKADINGNKSVSVLDIKEIIDTVKGN